MANLKRALGLPALTFYGIGQILGAGIYSIIGAAAGEAGEALWLSFLAAALVFFAYLGFEDIANLAEESARPERDLPKAIVLSLIVTTVLYVLVGLVVVALAPAADLAASRSPLVAALGPGRAFAPRALGAIALFATANTALITLIVTSRMLFGMARAGDLPAPLRRLTRRATPWVAAVVTLGLAALLIPFGRVAFVGGLSSLGALAGFSAVNVALIVLRYRQPDLRRPFRVPGRWGRMPVLPAAALVVLVAVIAVVRWATPC